MIFIHTPIFRKLAALAFIASFGASAWADTNFSGTAQYSDSFSEPLFQVGSPTQGYYLTLNGIVNGSCPNPVGCSPAEYNFFNFKSNNTIDASLYGRANSFTFTLTDPTIRVTDFQILTTGTGPNILFAPQFTPVFSVSHSDTQLFINYALNPNDPAPDFSASFALSTAPVPEPKALALMLAGLGAIGIAARRRKD